jgi:hypothetical protein
VLFRITFEIVFCSYSSTINLRRWRARTCWSEFFDGDTHGAETKPRTPAFHFPLHPSAGHPLPSSFPWWPPRPTPPATPRPATAIHIRRRGAAGVVTRERPPRPPAFLDGRRCRPIAVSAHRHRWWGLAYRHSRGSCAVGFESGTPRAAAPADRPRLPFHPFRWPNLPPRVALPTPRADSNLLS